MSFARGFPGGDAGQQAGRIRPRIAAFKPLDFAAGVVCVGMGSNLIAKELLASGEFQGITSKGKHTLEIMRAMREGK